MTIRQWRKYFEKYEKSNPNAKVMFGIIGDNIKNDLPYAVGKIFSINKGKRKLRSISIDIIDNN